VTEYLVDQYCAKCFCVLRAATSLTLCAFFLAVSDAAISASVPIRRLNWFRNSNAQIREQCRNNTRSLLFLDALLCSFIRS
jgi:hypothetical protein